MVRHASPLGETGMLAVDSMVPGGPAHNLLEPRDVLVHITGDVNTQFLKMETLLDDSVDRKIELQIERGGTPLTVDLLVQDLHSVTPDYVLDVSGAVIHPLSYQQAWSRKLKHQSNEGSREKTGIYRHGDGPWGFRTWQELQDQIGSST